VSFILDALRKSEHERQRSALPSLAHVPVATVQQQIPRWAVVVIATLAAAVLVLGGAWWQSSRAPDPAATSAAAVADPAIVERSLPLRPAEPPSAPVARAPTSIADSRSLADTAGSPTNEPRPVIEQAASPPAAAQAQAPAPAPAPAPTDDATALPSAAALMSEGVMLPPLRLELHGYAEQPSARFVFINGRKYGEGERLADGPDLVAVEPRGAVLSYAGRRFLLLPE
jgi:general secretion pathway protein B